jgi:D-alanyl-lipoteichoic acid acyltransferase DltB (MBOAT superfamily)
MVFSSTVFLFLFLPCVLVIYYNPIFKGRTFRNIFLLLASLAFYAWGEPVFVFLMLLSVLITWFLGLRLGNHNSKLILIIGITYHVAILYIFKYLTFTAEQIGLLLNKDLSGISISLPIGISFFTFQMMSYLFDVYYGKAEPQANPLYVGLYVSLFPQLIAGPIVRYEKIASEITNRHETYDDVVVGMQRFIYGLAKKVLLSNYVAQIADNVFDYMSGNMTVGLAWLGAFSYTLQIYFDFSGYSDMAIGLGRMFGFHFDENFNYPYIAKSVTDFWRRWHISLSSWFRDYVYIPLGGNRVKKSRWIFNLLVVWLLTGIWHGANWTFVAWGLLYFFILLVEKLTGFADRLGWLSHVYTMLVVIIAWVIFRAGDLKSAVVYIGNMFGIGVSGVWDAAVTNYIKGTYFVLIVSCVGITPLLKNIFVKLKGTKVSFIESLWIALIFVLSLLQLVKSTYNPFIYFNF